MDAFLSFTVVGLFSGAAYAIAAMGLVLTYNTTRVFNIAHGAFGMLFGFIFWDFSQRQGIPSFVSLLLVLLVVAPLVGWFVQRVLANNLGTAPVGVMLVVTVGMLVALIGIATQIWPALKIAGAPPREFYEGKSVDLGFTTITGHQLLTIVLSVVVAIVLYIFLTKTRLGAAMRASVDNPDLLRLYGGRPQLVAAVAWAVGMSLSALGGILLTPVLGLDYYQLTLVVISAYAAALLGKLTSLPLAYVGAIVLGLTQSYAVAYLPSTQFYAGVQRAVPALFLFALVVLLPQAPLRIGQIKGLKAPRVPSASKALAAAIVFVIVAMFASMGYSNPHLLLLDTALVYGIVMLSLVLLTGYGGYVSLAQFSLAGVGAVAYSKFGEPSLFGLLMAGLVAALVGALVALAVLRLTGLYLALATLAFAQLMDKMILGQDFAFGSGGLLTADRFSILGFNLQSEGRYTFVVAVFFILIALVVLWLRRGPLGRIVIASRDSQAACGTLGLDLRWFRVGLFSLSAFIAGIAGGLLAGQRGSFGPRDFDFFQSMLVLLAVVVFGVTTISGAFLGGLFLMYLPVAQSSHPQIAGLLFLILGGGAVALGRDPNGLANRIYEFFPWLRSTAYPALAERYPGLAFERISKSDRRALVSDFTPDNELDSEVDSDAVAAR